MVRVVTSSGLELRNLNVEALAERWWVLALRGVAAIAFGLFCLLAPGLSLFALVTLFAAYALVDGTANLVMGFRGRRRSGRRWGWLAFQGVVSVLASGVAFVWPGITAFVLVLVVACWSVITGFAAIAAAIRLRARIRGEWMLGLSGILSIAFGVLLFAFPGPGLVAIVLWLGAYSLLVGAILIALAYRLRAWGKDPEHGSGPELRQQRA
jgi:uncharacterized membrane protein HdeD (DUF308 family)